MGQYLSGKLSGIENALVTIGHEQYHQAGYEFGAPVHIYSDRNGFRQCQLLGYCNSMKLEK